VTSYMIVTDCVSMCFMTFPIHFLKFPEISEDLRERSVEVWAQCRALATELGEAEAALARRQAEECLGTDGTVVENFHRGRWTIPGF